jgi:D-psicose/D-tagatose/L-ribulose 3-epimerase
MQSQSSPQYGIIAPDGDADAILAAGADYIEPTIVGNVIVQDDEGAWQPNLALRRRPPSPSFAVLVPQDLHLSAPDFPLERIRGYLESAFSAISAVARPGAVVVLGSGAARRIPEGVEAADGRRRFAEAFGVARDVGAEHGLEVILEPLHQGETDLINSVAEAIAFLDEFGMGEVRVVADLFHIMLEHEPLAVISAHADRVAHAHIADTGRAPTGQGDWPLAEFLHALRSGGYMGHVSIECSWADLPAEAGPALAALRAADPVTSLQGA